MHASPLRAPALPPESAVTKPSPKLREGLGKCVSVLVGRHPAVLAAKQARTSYQETLKADLSALSGATDAKRWLANLTPQRAELAEKFLFSRASKLEDWTAGSYRDKAEAGRDVFNERARRAREQAAQYLEHEDRLIPSDQLEAVARYAFFLHMDNCRIDRGQIRQSLANKFIESVKKEEALKKPALQSLAQADSEEGVALAPRKDLASDPATLTLRELMEIASRHVQVPEGHSPASAFRRSPVTQDARRALHPHPVLSPLPKSSESTASNYRKAFHSMLGQLLAAFVGPGWEPRQAVGKLIDVLCRGANETDRHRATTLLISDGKPYDSAASDWNSLQRLVERANNAAFRRHAELVESGEQVGAQDARDFVRVELGEKLGIEAPSGDSVVRRNRASVQAIAELDKLFAEEPHQRVDQAVLHELIARVLGRREAEQPPAPAARSLPPQPLEPEVEPPNTDDVSDHPEASPAGSQREVGAGPSEQHAPLRQPAQTPLAARSSAAPRTVRVSPVPAGLHQLLDSASKLLSPEGAGVAVPAGNLAKAQEKLRTAADLISRSPPGTWTRGAMVRLKALQRTAEQASPAEPAGLAAGAASPDRSAPSAPLVRRLDDELHAAQDGDEAGPPSEDGPPDSGLQPARQQTQ